MRLTRFASGFSRGEPRVFLETYPLGEPTPRSHGVRYPTLAIGDLVMRASTPTCIEEGLAAAMAWGAGLGVGAALLRGHGLGRSQGSTPFLSTPRRMRYRSQ